MKKKYKIKATPQLIKKLKPYWATYRLIEGKFWRLVKHLEKKMAKELGIKDIEIFFCDNEAVGIGNATRTMELIQREKLENGLET